MKNDILYIELKPNKINKIITGVIDKNGLLNTHLDLRPDIESKH